MKTKTPFLGLALEIFEIGNNEKSKCKTKKKPKLKNKFLWQNFLFYKFFRRLLKSCLQKSEMFKSKAQQNKIILELKNNLYPFFVT